MNSDNLTQKPAHDVADVLGGTFPGHTMQRLRTPDGKYRYSYVSAGVKESFGLDPMVLMHQDAVDHDWLHPDDKDRFIAALEHSASTLSQLDEEVRVARTEGGYTWVRSIGKPRRLADGTVIWDGVALDVTDRYEALEALERTLSQVRLNETSEGRFSYIAASDVMDRLVSLRAAVNRLSAETDGSAREVVDRFQHFERALFAARDLVQVHSADAVSNMADVQSDGAGRLTRRQSAIMDLVSRGTSNKDIAVTLGISEGTVKVHMSSVLKKLKVHNRTEAAHVWKRLAG